MNQNQVTLNKTFDYLSPNSQTKLTVKQLMYSLIWFEKTDRETSLKIIFPFPTEQYSVQLIKTKPEKIDSDYLTRVSIIRAYEKSNRILHKTDDIL